MTTVLPDTAPAAPQASTAANTHTSEPRFQSIAEQIRTSIVSGHWPAHTGVPSERDIAQRHGVSRMTARRALESLEHEGLLYSEKRRGRFVSPPRLSYDVSNRVSFVTDAQATGIDLHIELIEAHEASADASLSRQLAVPAGQKVYQYTRLFRSHGHAIFLETEYILAQRFPDFLDYDLQQSTTRILETHYGTSAKTGDIVIRLCSVSNTEAQLLGLASGQPGIELEQQICDKNGAPFCFGRQLWRGELAEFRARAIVNAPSPA